jgi:hypothetical protein
MFLSKIQKEWNVWVWLWPAVNEISDLKYHVADMSRAILHSVVV